MGFNAESNALEGDIDTISSENHQEIEPLRDVNEHTTGREYYGRSSNFALLGKLFTHARSNSSGSGRPEMSRQSALFTTKASSEGSMRLSGLDFHRPAVENQMGRANPPAINRLSIINLLYDEGTSVAEPNPTPSVLVHSEKDRVTSSASIRNPAQKSNTDPNGILAVDDTSPARSTNQGRRVISTQPYRRGTFPTNQASDNFGRSSLEMVIEKEYLRLFFANLYYIHPFLSQDQFSARCQTIIWSRWPLKGIPRGDQHFVALYNVILAVGSLTGSSDTFMVYKNQLDNDLDAGHSDMSSATSSIQLSKIFFDRSKRLLGDCFEVCSLESAQTLLLMVSLP